MAIIAFLPQQALIAENSDVDTKTLICTGEIWVREGPLDNKRLIFHSALTIQVTLDKDKGILRVDSPYSIKEVAGGDQILVRETLGLHYFITPQDRDIARKRGIESVGSPVNYSSSLNRVSGQLSLMEGQIFADGMHSAFGGTCERPVQRF